MAVVQVFSEGIFRMTLTDKDLIDSCKEPEITDEKVIKVVEHEALEIGSSIKNDSSFCAFKSLHSNSMKYTIGLFTIIGYSTVIISSLLHQCPFPNPLLLFPMYPEYGYPYP